MRHKRRKVPWRTAREKTKRLVRQLEAAPFGAAPQCRRLLRLGERLEAMHFGRGQARGQVRQPDGSRRRRAGRRERQPSTALDDAVEQRKQRGFPIGQAGDRVEAVERDQVESLEAVQQRGSLPLHNGERQPGRRAPRASRTSAGRLEQVAFAAAGRAEDPHRRTRFAVRQTPERLDDARIPARCKSLEAERDTELNSERELAHGPTARRGGPG